MKKPLEAADRIIARAGEDRGFRARLLAQPRAAIEEEFGVTLADGHEICVHEETCAETHLVLPPPSRFTEAEREEARTGAASLAFLRKTLHDPAPPLRPPAPEGERASPAGAEIPARAGRESIVRALAFLESRIAGNGAWHCIRFNTADPAIPRHFERPPFVSAFCALALEHCAEAKARALCRAARSYLAETIEYPGLWRYYRHLPPDLDSTALCSLVAGGHPWVVLGRNLPPILANRDGDGRFTTWILAEDEPEVVPRFRIEADPVVNANVIAHLGDRPETRPAQHWLEALVREDRAEGLSKWYPDKIAFYYALTRAVRRVQPALDRLRPVLAERILDLGDERGGFGNLLQTAQAISALYRVGGLESLDARCQVDTFTRSQRDDGSWPELLAFGDSSLKWGTAGQIGHGSESVTTAFCIEALGHLFEVLDA